VEAPACFFGAMVKCYSGGDKLDEDLWPIYNDILEELSKTMLGAVVVDIRPSKHVYKSSLGEGSSSVRTDLLFSFFHEESSNNFYFNKDHSKDFVPTMMQQQQQQAGGALHHKTIMHSSSKGKKFYVPSEVFSEFLIAQYNLWQGHDSKSEFARAVSESISVTMKQVKKDLEAALLQDSEV